MRAKSLNENGGYPIGAEHDPKAPWNEKDDDSKITIKNDGAFIEIIKSEQIEEDEWEEVDKVTIDPYDLNVYVVEKLDLDPDALVDNDAIEIEDIDEIREDEYKLLVKLKISISLEELYELADKSTKRNLERRKK